MRLPKRSRPIIALLTGPALLVVLAIVLLRCGPQPAPKPHASSSPAATVAASPRPSPTLRPPQPITTQPPTADPSVTGGPGKG